MASLQTKIRGSLENICHNLIAHMGNALNYRPEGQTTDQPFSVEAENYTESEPRDISHLPEIPAIFCTGEEYLCHLAQSAGIARFELDILNQTTSPTLELLPAPFIRDLYQKLNSMLLKLNVNPDIIESCIIRFDFSNLPEGSNWSSFALAEAISEIRTLSGEVIAIKR